MYAPKRLYEKSGECHNHNPQPTPTPKERVKKKKNKQQKVCKTNIQMQAKHI